MGVTAAEPAGTALQTALNCEALTV